MKWIRKLFFSRLTFIVIGLLIQFSALISLIAWFNDYFSYFYGISMAISFTLVFMIVNNDSNPAYKIAWIIPILALPIFGGIIYLFFGTTRFNRRQKKKMTQAMDEKRIKHFSKSKLSEIEALDPI